jgi:hypothetical protein
MIQFFRGFLSGYTIRRLLIRLMPTIQKIAVTRIIYPRLSPAIPVSSGKVSIRIIATRWVSGSSKSAIYWKSIGSRVRGKKVPEKRVIGVMKRKEG